MANLPTGTVTFLFTDIEGSTRLLQELGERYRRVQDDHAEILRRAIAAGGGVEIRTEGDSFFAVFPAAVGAVRAAVSAQRDLDAHGWTHGEPLRVRMGIHTGEGVAGGDDYVGIDVNRAARIAAAGHGGQVLLSDASRVLAEAHLPDGVSLRDLGVHRLKDLRAPERLYQLDVDGLRASFPPIASLETPTLLPAEATSFVGRAAEVARMRELVGRERLVTLTGPGGSGKTRLAIRAASGLTERFPDGVFFVALSGIAEPDLVCPTICRVIGLRDEGVEGAMETLEQFMGARRALLVLDNFEQVLDAAPFVADLLAACRSLHVLVTSRAVLRLAGEHDAPVPPLGLGDEGSASEAVELFAERAAAVDPAFAVTGDNAAVIREICARLDGLPLAVELAAARVRILPPSALLERLGDALPLLTACPRDAPERQRTLEGTIRWSHDLLDEPERALFARLAVFAGGCILDAADEVANPGREIDGDTLDVLGRLVDHSLVRARDRGTASPRFDMLRTIREFALGRLEERGERSRVEERFIGRFLALAEDAEPHYRRLEAKEWLDALELEHDNLQEALRLTVEADRGELALRLIAALWRFWHVHGHLTAARRWAETVLGLPSVRERTLLRARGLTALGGLAYWQFDAQATRTAYEEASSIFEELDDLPGRAENAYNLGFAAGLEDDIEAARATIERSRRLFEQAGIERGVADTLWVVGIFARLDGDLETSRQLGKRSLEMHRALGDMFGMVDALEVYGRAMFELGELDEARACVLETLDLVEPIENRTGIAVALDNLAAHANATERPERAVILGGASDAVKRSAGGAAPPQLVDLPDPRIAARAALDEDRVRALWEAGAAMTIPAALAYARERP